jgi:hypothetical protein
MLQWLLQFLKWLLKPLPKLGISATLTIANASCCCTFPPMQSEPFNCRDRLPESWFPFRRKILLYAVRVLLLISDCHDKYKNEANSKNHLHVEHMQPVHFFQLKGRPWDLLFNLAVMVNGCHWAIQFISQCNEKLYGLGCISVIDQQSGNPLT